MLSTPSGSYCSYYFYVAYVLSNTQAIIACSLITSVALLADQGGARDLQVSIATRGVTHTCNSPFQPHVSKKFQQKFCRCAATLGGGLINERHLRIELRLDLVYAAGGLTYVRAVRDTEITAP